MPRNLIIICSLILLILAGCSSDETDVYLVRLQIDGSEYIYQHSELVTVNRFLQEINVELGTLDRVYPELWTQISDEMRITVVRVYEEEYCEQHEIPYRRLTELAEGISGEQIAQVGRNGVEEVCYRVVVENSIRQEPQQIRRIRISDPIDEITFVSPSQQLDLITINGTLHYINNGNVWVVRGDSTRRRPLTNDGDLDGRAFSVTADGQQVLFTRRTENQATFNQLWYIPNTLLPSPSVIQLLPQDILYAEWIPNRSNTLSYSTAERQQASPGWRAFNDLWFMTVDPETGSQIRIEPVLEPSSGGIAGWWGTQYEWSPDGQSLVWIRADSIGLVDLETKSLSAPLLRYEYFNPPAQDWSWRTTVSWSGNNDLLLATTHGAPIGNEPASASPVFNISMVSTNGNYSADLVERAGIWSTPRFSPLRNVGTRGEQEGYMVYLQARQWDASINSEYDLVLADRDGSNGRVIFPERTQTGLKADQFAQDFSWSPDGDQLAIIYLGNLWIIDVQTGRSHQITQDGRASKPIWTR
jgi:hypothetical protein